METLGLITDRTQSDVDYGKEIYSLVASNGIDSLSSIQLKLWNAGLKGRYGATDYNRVGRAVNRIADMLNEAGYPVDVTAKTDWGNNDIPSPSTTTVFLNDISKIKSAFYAFSTTPPLPASMSRLNYWQANNIEQILSDVFVLIGNMTDTYRYLGTDLICGEDNYA